MCGGKIILHVAMCGKQSLLYCSMCGKSSLFCCFKCRKSLLHHSMCGKTNLSNHFILMIQSKLQNKTKQNIHGKRSLLHYFMCGKRIIITFLSLGLASSLVFNIHFCTVSMSQLLKIYQLYLFKLYIQESQLAVPIMLPPLWEHQIQRVFNSDLAG